MITLLNRSASTPARSIHARSIRLAASAGADGITAHLREDRRHISDTDIARLKQELTRPLNLEMAATPEMLAIALRDLMADPDLCLRMGRAAQDRVAAMTWERALKQVVLV